MHKLLLWYNQFILRTCLSRCTQISYFRMIFYLVSSHPVRPNTWTTLLANTSSPSLGDELDGVD
jgi:hypothetical protein